MTTNKVRFLATSILLSLNILTALLVVGTRNGLKESKKQIWEEWLPLQNLIVLRANVALDWCQANPQQAKPYSKLIEKLSKGRSQAKNAFELEEFRSSYQNLSAAMGQFYFAFNKQEKLLSQLRSFEPRIDFQRRKFNASVWIYNNRFRIFPGGLVAALYGYDRAMIYI